MNEQMSKERTLTPIEEVKAKEQAYQAFMREMEMRMPKPEPQSSDYVHENAAVVKTLKAVISILPAILGIIAIAAILISADKTFTAFNVGVSNKYGAIAFALGICGVVMTELGLVYVEFAIVRERLKKGLRRRVFNFKDVVRAWRVIKGDAEPLDYSDMPDQSLVAYSRLIFGVVLAANLFGAYKATEDDADPISIGFALALGVAGAFSLRFIGAQLAHITYEIMQQDREAMKREINAVWRAEMDRRWQVFEDDLIARELHRAYIVKNKLDIDSPSPYLLQAGEGGELEPVPFSTVEWHENSQTSSRNGY